MTKPTPEPPSSTPPPPDLQEVALIAQLWADQFQHMTTLGLAGGGGMLILVQAGLVATGTSFWLTLVFFALLSTLSLVGQTSVVDDATKGERPGRQARAARSLALVCLGMAAAALIDTLT